MPVINFASYQYVPVLAGGEVERVAFSRLRPNTRSGILPVFELARYRGGVDFSQSKQMLLETVGVPFLLDVDKRLAPAPYQAQNPSDPAAEALRVARETLEVNAFNTFLNNLLSPADGFANWRSFAQQFEFAAPVIQYTNPAQQNGNILRQAALLASASGSMALRIKQEQSELLCGIASQIISILPNSSRVLLIFDCGQGRLHGDEKAAWVRGSMQAILGMIEPELVSGISAICMSNSYPQLNHTGIKEITNLDREIWIDACEEFQFGFGDYAANARNNNLSSFLPRNYRATVVHTQDSKWVTHRHENADDLSGYAQGCARILAEGLFDPIDSWTDEVIEEVAGGNLGEMSTPRLWHGARIAGHIERQFAYVPDFGDQGD